MRLGWVLGLVSCLRLHLSLSSLILGLSLSLRSCVSIVAVCNGACGQCGTANSCCCGCSHGARVSAAMVHALLHGRCASLLAGWRRILIDVVGDVNVFCTANIVLHRA